MSDTLERIILAGVIALVCCAARVSAAPGYQHSVVGNPAEVTTTTSGLLVLQGGVETSWASSCIPP